MYIEIRTFEPIYNNALYIVNEQISFVFLSQKYQSWPTSINYAVEPSLLFITVLGIKTMERKR